MSSVQNDPGLQPEVSQDEEATFTVNHLLWTSPSLTGTDAAVAEIKTQRGLAFTTDGRMHGRTDGRTHGQQMQGLVQKR